MVSPKKRIWIALIPVAVLGNRPGRRGRPLRKF